MKKYTSEIPVTIWVDTYAEDEAEASDRSYDKLKERLNKVLGTGNWDCDSSEIRTEKADDLEPDGDWITEDEREVG